MRSLLLSILIFTALFSCSQKVNYTGTWFGEAMMKTDSTYENLNILIEIYENGTFSGFGGKTQHGEWKVANNEILFSADTLSFKGTVLNGKLIISEINNYQDTKLIFEKIENSNRLDWDPEKLQNKLLSVSLNDSLHYNFHFIDSFQVVIYKNQVDYFEEINPGYYRIFEFNGYKFLSIAHNAAMENLVFLIYENVSSNLKAKITLISESDKSFETIDCTLENESLLSNGEISVLNETLQGNWNAINEFYPKKKIYDDEILSDIYFNLNFTDTLFSIKYGGKGKTTKYEKVKTGSWELSETGQYLKLKYEKVYQNRSMSLTDYVLISDISENLLDISIGLETIKAERGYFSGIEIKLKK